jgi:WD40 repeat protein
VFFCDLRAVEIGGGIEIYPKNVGDKHSGVPVCLEWDYEDTFYTAGYDGLVIRHEAPNTEGKQWYSRKIVDVSEVTPGTDDSTIRTICLFRRNPADLCQGIFLGDESRRLHFWDAREQKLTLITRFRYEVFALVLSKFSKRLAVGLSNGSVYVFDVSDDPREIQIVADRLVMPCGSIIRSLAFLENDRILSVSWAGSVRIWSIESEACEFQFDVAPGELRPGDDCDKLIFGENVDFDGIRGISKSFLNYLKMMERCRVEPH